jgi:hypothetical protein
VKFIFKKKDDHSEISEQIEAMAAEILFRSKRCFNIGFSLSFIIAYDVLSVDTLFGYGLCDPSNHWCMLVSVLLIQANTQWPYKIRIRKYAPFAYKNWIKSPYKNHSIKKKGGKRKRKWTLRIKMSTTSKYQGEK